MNKKKKNKAKYTYESVPENMRNSIYNITVGIAKLNTEELSQEKQVKVLNAVEDAIIELKKQFIDFGISLGLEHCDYNTSFVTVDATGDKYAS